MSRSERSRLHFPKIHPDSGPVSLLDVGYCSVIHTSATVYAHLGTWPILNFCLYTRDRVERLFEQQPWLEIQV